MTGALKDFLRSQPVKRSEAAKRPQLNPRPPDAKRTSAAMDVLLRLIRDLPGSLEYLREHAA